MRLTPSVEGSWRPVEQLALRTRQGALLDAAGEGARLWAWAFGVDWAPLEWLALGVELDASIGAFADRQGAALGLGGGVEMRWGLFEIAAGPPCSLCVSTPAEQVELHTPPDPPPMQGFVPLAPRTTDQTTEPEPPIYAAW